MPKAIIIFCVLPTLLAISCNSLKLTEKEAISLIRKANGYPKLKATYLYDFSHQEIRRLVRENYLIFEDSTKSGRVIKTDKGKRLIEFVDFRRSNYRYTVAPFTHKVDIKKITEIFVDSNDNSAIVKYKVGYFPTEYFIHLRELNKEEMDRVSRNYEDYIKQMRLKKSTQGWQVIDDSIITVGSKREK